MAFLQSVLDWMNSNLGSSVTVVMLVAEFLFRLIPSEKPKSIILAVAKAFELVGNILVSAANFLNKIIPQNLK